MDTKSLIQGQPHTWGKRKGGREGGREGKKPLKNAGFNLSVGEFHFALNYMTDC